MKFIFQVVKEDNREKLEFGNDENRAKFQRWLKFNVGAYGKIEPLDKITKESRGYFEGALVPAYIEWSGGDPNNLGEQEKIREILKYEFNSVVVNDLNGNPIRIPKSTAKLSRTEFKFEFIAKIVDYYTTHGIPVPNPELYKTWKNKWSTRYPLHSFWQFLDMLDLKCDMGVEDATTYIPKDERPRPNYPTNKLKPKF